MKKISFKELRITKSLLTALKELYRENVFDKASVLAYYSIISTLFLLTFFSFIFTKVLGSTDISIKGVYPFSPEFFNSISPDFLDKANEISSNLKNIGIVGVLLSFFLAVLIFKKVVQYVNEMFHINLSIGDKNKAFWVRRASEIALLFIVGLLGVGSFLITGFITTVTSLFKESPVAKYINPESIEALNKFGVKFIAPFAITFLIFFFIFKWIPEKKVCIKGAFISALISALIWEFTKRVYTYYLVKVSIVGKLGGPIIAIILFGFWMEFSMGVMLFGAKLTSIFDRGRDEQLKKAKRNS
ncbi:MAG: YihY/virulence factor BrkB family protein [Candidatus Aminicenantes bacterium]|nr:YihY/virulence factor BrkB family protein [Candidatus Aminicenantes bacterium]